VVGILGIVIGVIASILIGRYYYRRTVHKDLSIFGLLNSEVFAGIAPDVREQLHFRFKDREVTELQQLLFLVANTGERAIRDVIETLRLDLPPTAAILDASIVHRHPEDLNATLHVTQMDRAEGSVVRLDFPLLNTKEFFIVKMLLSGKLPQAPLTFHLLCDDLPRTIPISRLPPTAYDDRPYKFEWALAAGATGVLAIPAWLCYAIYQLSLSRPELFPYPWDTFVPSLDSALVVLPTIVLVAGFTFLGLMILGAAIFGGEFPPKKGPRFPLPKSVRAAVFPYRMWRFHPEFGETPVVSAAPKVGGGAGTEEGKHG
jgi:hypothetical protein